MTGAAIVWRPLPPLLASMLGAYLMRSIFYKSSVGVEHLRLRVFYQITGAYNFVSSIIPFGLGHLSYTFLLKKHYGVAVGRRLSSLISYNVFRMVILSFLFAYSGVVLDVFRWISPPVIETAAVVFTASAALVLFLKFNRTGITGIAGKYIGVAKNIVDDLKQQMHPGRAARLVVYSTGVAAFNIASVFYIYRLIDQPLPVTAIIFLFSAGNLSRILPIHGPGGFGSIEAIN